MCTLVPHPPFPTPLVSLERPLRSGMAANEALVSVVPRRTDELSCLYLHLEAGLFFAFSVPVPRLVPAQRRDFQVLSPRYHRPSGEEVAMCCLLIVLFIQSNVTSSLTAEASN
ncbi:hypothetical protein DPEC_G00119920 [Dallia pectoralis]|uniref:Uncharacterized protein n=1 Tax=Dallia pectoralis TaxID=75939 RepID=A0ACC2GPK4_DALPE|nr:hypothetical protein DPEC_G00119920 [Dallia pectoralis]